MGPRPDGRGKSELGGGRRRPVRRQWGRGQTAAESRVACRHNVNLQARQWGRGQTAAERSRRNSAVCPEVSVNGAAARRPRKVGEFGDWRVVGVGRQWGRGQTAAERRHGGLDVDLLPRVNGAAARRPRKDRVGILAAPRPEASMGPRPDGRGKAKRGGMSFHVEAASMGPRPDGRGKLGASGPTAVQSSRQWGRGQTAAERLQPRP